MFRSYDHLHAEIYNFADKRRSPGWYSSLVDSVHGVHLVFSFLVFCVDASGFQFVSYFWSTPWARSVLCEPSRFAPHYRYYNSEKSVKDTTYDCQRSMVCPQYNTSWRLECAVSKGSNKTKKHNLPQQNRRTCKRSNSTATTTTQPKKTKKQLASRPTRRLTRNYFWIILFTLYWIRAN
jgi:hypothetical protein